MTKINKKNEAGCLVWITGLPGAGKTILANTLYELIKDEMPTVRLDGDAIREIMDNDLGYDPEHRKMNAFRLAKLSKHLVDHNLTVICSTVSLIKEIHQWNKENVKNLIEVYIEVPMETLFRRDQKNLYSHATSGKIKNVYAIDQNYDLPENPHFILKNDSSLDDFLKQAEKLKNKILNKK